MHSLDVLRVDEVGRRIPAGPSVGTWYYYYKNNVTSRQDIETNLRVKEYVHTYLVLRVCRVIACSIVIQVSCNLE